MWFVVLTHCWYHDYEAPPNSVRAQMQTKGRGLCETSSMKLLSICCRRVSKKNPISDGCIERWSHYCLAVQRSTSIVPGSTRYLSLSPSFRQTVRWWSPHQQALNTLSISSRFPAFGTASARGMGSGGSKGKNKRGKASKEGEPQAQEQAQGQSEKPVSEGTSEQPRQQGAQVEQAATESEARMAEEYVEAVVAKASEFGDNQ